MNEVTENDDPFSPGARHSLGQQGKVTAGGQKANRRVNRHAARGERGDFAKVQIRNQQRAPGRPPDGFVRPQVQLMPAKGDGAASGLC